MSMHMGYFTDFIMISIARLREVLWITVVCERHCNHRGASLLLISREKVLSVERVNTLVCELIGQEQGDVIDWIWVI